MKRLHLILSSSAIWMIVLLGSIHSSFASSNTRNPPYDVGYAGGDGVQQVDATYTEYHYLTLLNGTAKLYDSIAGSIIGAGAKAESWGYQGISWTCPGDPGGPGGGCPYVGVWDGRQYVLDNNLLPRSEYSSGDVEDVYALQKPLYSEGGTYKLQLSEFEHEHDFIDQVELVSVDHPHGTSVAVTPEGELLTYCNPVAPRICVDNNGRSRLAETRCIDGNVSDPATYFQGNKGDWLLLDFGKVTATNGKLILRDDQKCSEDRCINVQVPGPKGSWQTVEVLDPRNLWALEAANMTAYIPAHGDFIARLYWTRSHRLDYVGLDTSPQADTYLHSLELLSAQHSIDGDVTFKLLYEDYQYAELRPGKQIELIFNSSRSSLDSTKVLFVKGHYFTTAERDPLVTVTSKLNLNGHAGVIAIAVAPFNAQCLYDFQIWLEVYDITVGAYNTRTLIYDKSDVSYPYDGGKYFTWNGDQDATSSFSADAGHQYNIYIGVYTKVIGAALGAGMFFGSIDFSSYNGNDYYILTRYISLSW